MGLFTRQEPQQVVVKTLGVDLKCQLCGFDRFHRRYAKLYRGIMAYWLDPLADCCVCGRCGFIHGFLGAK